MLWSPRVWLLMLMTLLASCTAEALDVWGCANTSGTPGGPSCGGSTCDSAGWMAAESAVMVSVWAGTAAVVGDAAPACDAPDGENVWRSLPDGIEAGDLIVNGSTFLLAEPEFFGYTVGGGGGDDGGDDDAESPWPELTLAQASALAGAALLLLCAAFIGRIVRKTLEKSI